MRDCSRYYFVHLNYEWKKAADFAKALIRRLKTVSFDLLRQMKQGNFVALVHKVHIAFGQNSLPAVAVVENFVDLVARDRTREKETLPVFATQNS